MRYLKLLFFILVLSTGINAQKQISIAVLADQYNSEENFELLRKEIDAVLGSNYNTVFQTPQFNNFDLNAARSQYLELDATTTDLIIAVGTTNAVLFYEEEDIKIPTIVVGGVNRDLIDLPAEQETSQKNNVNYIILPNSYTNDLDDLASIDEFEKVGVIINPKKLNTLPIKLIFDDYFQRSDDASYVFIPLVDNNIDASLLDNVDAVYLADGFGLADADINRIIDAINERKLPSFSANGIEDVERGMLASNKPRSTLGQLVRKIALHTEFIVSGTNPSALPLFVEYNNQLTINFTTAQEIGLRLRYSLLGAANMITSPAANDVNTENQVSLKTLMHQVVNQNLSLSADRKNIDLAEQDVKTSKSNYLPDVSANVQGVYIDPEVAQYSNGQNPEIGASGNVQIQQLLYSPGASTGIKINEQLAAAQQENYNAAQLDAMYNMAASYFNALVLRANAHIQNQNLQVTKQNLEIALQNFNAGSSGKTDVLRFRSQLAQNTQNVIDAGNQLQQIMLTINQLRNVDLRTEFELEDANLSSGLFKDYNYEQLVRLLDSPELLDKLVDFFTQESIKNAPELKNLNFNMQANQLNYKLNDSGRYLPTVALQGQYSLSFLREGKGAEVPPGFPTLPNNTYNAAVNVSLPIFNQNTRNINRQIAKIQGEQLNIQKENITLNLERQIQEVVLQMISNIANLEISKVSEEAARESLDLAQTAYQAGAVPVIQLIDAQTNYLQAQLGRTTAKYQFLLTAFQLERYLGQFFIMQTREENEAFFQRAQEFILAN